MALGGGGGGGARDVRAGRAVVELGVKDSMTAALKRLAGRFASFGKQVLALTGVGGLLGGALGGLGFKETADDLSKVNDVAKAFGITGRQASGLFGVLGAVGGDFKENIEGIVQFSATMDKALQGVGQGVELFNGLAVTAKQLEGLDVDEQFYRVLGAIRQLPQGMQQSKLALLGGSDSLKQWQRLLSMSEVEVRALAKDLAVSSTELEEAAQASKALQQAGAAANRVWQQVVITLSPLVKQGADWATGGLKQAADWLKGRTLQHIWDEAVATFQVGWEQVKQWGLEAWLTVSGAATDAWYDIEAKAATTLIDLQTWVDKFLGEDLWAKLAVGFAVQLNAVEKLFTDELDRMVMKAKLVGNLIAQALAGKAVEAASPAAATITGEDIQQAIEAGKVNGAATPGDLAKDAFRRAAERKKAEAAGKRDAQRQAGQDALQRAQDNLAETKARIERERQQRQADEEVARNARIQEKVAQIGRSLGTFGAGSFLGQAYGVQSAEKDVGKLLNEGNKEAKKQTGLLAKIAERSGLVVT